MADYYIAPKTSFDATADAVRAIKGTNTDITWGQDGFASEIGSSRRYSLDEIVSTSAISGDLVLSGPCTSTRKGAFYNCTSLTSIYSDYDFAPQTYLFYGCTNLVSVRFPNMRANALASDWLRNCTNLRVYDNGYVQFVWGGDTFNGCTSLETIILRRNQTNIASMSTANVFRGCTPIQSGGSGVTIYIPKVYYDHLGDGTALDYQSATGWSTFHNYGTITWAQIEGSIYE